jgi:hypothetical protein
MYHYGYFYQVMMIVFRALFFYIIIYRVIYEE